MQLDAARVQRFANAWKPWVACAHRFDELLQDRRAVCRKVPVTMEIACHMFVRIDCVIIRARQGGTHLRVDGLATPTGFRCGEASSNLGGGEHAR